MSSRLPKLLLAVAATACVVVVASLCAPYLYAEYQFDLHGQAPSATPKLAGAVAGRWIDDYFVVEALDAATFAIGEPRY